MERPNPFLASTRGRSLRRAGGDSAGYVLWGFAVVIADVVTRSHHHQVLFYDVDLDLAGAVADHVTAGISHDEPAIVIATAAHLSAIDAALCDRGLDVSRAKASGRYVPLDAAETLDSFMVDGLPDSDRFTTVIGGLLDPMPAGSDVRAFGEMVALLWDQGNVAGAIALESLWNDLAEHRQFSLLCAYPMAALHAADLDDVKQVCHLHSAVLPPSSYLSASSTGLEEDDVNPSGVFVGVPEAVAAARRFVAETLTSWGEKHLVWDGALIVSELATNAVIHGGSPFRASLERVTDVVRIAVEDVGPGLPQSRSMLDDALDGRGVAIVEELAHRWGCVPTDRGKVFWAELEVSPAQAG